MIEHPIPEADTAEQALLGAAMLYPECLDSEVMPYSDGSRVPGLILVRDLRPEDFRSPDRATAWRILLTGAHDPIVLESELRAAGTLRPDLTLLLHWCDRCPTRYGAPGWARLVRDAARQRGLLSLAQAIPDAVALCTPTEEVVRSIRRSLEAL